MSGMAQATAVQALSRAAVALGAPRYARLARRALGAFETPPPAGVAVPTAGGRRYVMYSFAPALQILNGELQAINGLRDAAVLGRSERAARLVASGDRAARSALGGFDTGAWSLYSSAGAESTLAYHQLTRNILTELCRRTGAPSTAAPSAASRATRRTAADRDRAAARALGAAQRAAALHALEGLRGPGARVRTTRGRARARPTARSRRPRADLDSALPRPLPRARVRARPGGPVG